MAGAREVDRRLALRTNRPIRVMWEDVITRIVGIDEDTFVCRCAVERPLCGWRLAQPIDEHRGAERLEVEMLGRGRRMRRRGMVAGAAIATHRQNEAYQQGAQAAAPEPSYEAPSPAPAAPAPDPMDAKMAALEKLGELHESGVLTDEEFAAEKAKILNS